MPTHLVASFLAISALCLSCLGQAFTERDLAFMGVIGSGDITNACDITHDLLSKWTFNESGGITVYDSAGGRNGTLSAVAGGHSLPQWNTPGFGMYNTNVNFPDSYAYVTFGASPYWNFYTNQQWTFTIWANHTNSTWNQQEGLVTINRSLSDPTTGFSLLQDRVHFVQCGNKQYWSINFNACRFITTGADYWDICYLDNNTVTNLTQYFWSIVRYFDKITVYTNGTLAGTNSFYANDIAGRPKIVSDSPTLWVGGNYQPGALRGWQGNIQEMRIYRASLTATEITNLWNHLANNGPCP